MKSLSAGEVRIRTSSISTLGISGSRCAVNSTWPSISAHDERRSKRARIMRGTGDLLIADHVSWSNQVLAPRFPPRLISNGGYLSFFCRKPSFGLTISTTRFSPASALPQMDGRRRSQAARPACPATGSSNVSRTSSPDDTAVAANLLTARRVSALGTCFATAHAMRPQRASSSSWTPGYAFVRMCRSCASSRAARRAALLWPVIIQSHT
mmetsp:Transcript_47404/g.94582  ORF Transcript_47404/g.94582 Transcript_47404/m.94582 type:complete len:210 (-) Transcript_47404:40-669(-)